MCNPRAHIDGIVVFPLQQWLCEHATVLHYMHIACFDVIEVTQYFQFPIYFIMDKFEVKIPWLYSRWNHYHRPG